MEEINILDFFKFLQKKIYIIVIIAVLFLAVGIIYTAYYQKPAYKSETTLLLLKASDSSDSLNQSDLLMNQNLITTYSEIIKSNKVLDKVIKELNLNKSINELNSMISVTSAKSSIIIVINVKSKDKKEAMDIANSVAKVFCEEIKSLLNMQNVGIVDTAVEAKAPFNVQPVKQIGISLFAGIFISLSILFVIYYFDTTVKSEEQIEKETGLSVIGIVPMKKRSSKWKKN